MQYSLGIGSGSFVNDSGEEKVIKIASSTFTPQNAPLYIFDVGANVGKYTSLCLEHLNGGGASNTQIHCFEPSQHTFNILQNTHSNNPIVHLNNCGLGANEQTMTLYSDGPASGLASLTKRRLTHHNIDFSQSEQVRIITLDNYCANAHIPHIHLLKVDVEGHELDVFNGALGMFEDDKIDMVTFEFGGCNIDTRTYFQDFWYFFKTYNMNIYRILPNQRLYHITSYNESREQFDTTNYVAISTKYGIFK